MSGTPWLPPHFGPLVALCLVAFGLLWWFTLGARRTARRRLLRRRIAAFDLPATPSALAPLAGMRQTLAQARETLVPLPVQPGRRSALYVIPWFLFIGDRAADVRGLLSAAHPAPTLPAPGGQDVADEPFWQWWFMHAMTAIETSTAVVSASDARHAHGVWHQALMALAEQRDRLPLNGLVVCVGASSLCDDRDALASLALRLRRRIDEATEYLRLRLPVYLVVTGLEQLPGYDAMHRALPREVLGQALGHRMLQRAPLGESPAQRLDAMFEPIALRLHALGMGLLPTLHDATARQAIHAFVEATHALQPGLRAVADHLFSHASHGLRSPRWRGLYFTAASTAGGDADADAGADGIGDGAFVADLFDRFLPADQPLARP